PMEALLARERDDLEPVLLLQFRNKHGIERRGALGVRRRPARDGKQNHAPQIRRQLRIARMIHRRKKWPAINAVVNRRRGAARKPQRQDPGERGEKGATATRKRKSHAALSY